MHGAGALTVLRRITVRLAWPGILAAAIYIFMTAFAAFDVPAIIGWGNRIFTFTHLSLPAAQSAGRRCRAMGSAPRSSTRRAWRSRR